MATLKPPHKDLDVDLEALPMKSDSEQDTKVKASPRDWITDVLMAAALMAALCKCIKYLESVPSLLSWGLLG